MKNILLNLKHYNYKKIIFPTIIILFYLLGFIYLFYLYLKIDNNDKEKNIFEEDNVLVVTQEDIIENKKIIVDVKGSVNNPGVYELNEGQRVIDAIKSSGGLKKNANTRFINLSKELKDGDVIVIYSNEEIEKANETKTIIVETPCICEEVKNDGCILENNTNQDQSDSIVNNGSGESKLININTANKEELMELNGIGESKAIAIIEYRESIGYFKSIDDILNVNGISENTFEKIKSNITI